jgi:hypothetical protein
LEGAKAGYRAVVEYLVDEPTVLAEAWATVDGNMSRSTRSNGKTTNSLSKVSRRAIPSHAGIPPLRQSLERPGVVEMRIRTVPKGGQSAGDPNILSFFCPANPARPVDY